MTHSLLVGPAEAEWNWRFHFSQYYRPCNHGWKMGTDWSVGPCSRADLACSAWMTRDSWPPDGVTWRYSGPYAFGSGLCSWSTYWRGSSCSLLDSEHSLPRCCGVEGAVFSTCCQGAAVFGPSLAVAEKSSLVVPVVQAGPLPSCLRWQDYAVVASANSMKV